MSDVKKPLSGKRVFLYFFLFFGVIIAVNTVFITKALKTHSGLVTEDAYEKGLAYNETLESARTQPHLENALSYRDGVLRWVLLIEDAAVTAKFIRPVRDGDDFDMALAYVGHGTYEAIPDMPVKGVWTVKLKAIWNNGTAQTFQASHSLSVQ